MRNRLFYPGTYALIVVVYGYFVLANSILFQWNYQVELIGWVGMCLLIGIYLVVRRKVGLPKSGLEIPALVYLLVLLLTIAFSPDPRIGLEKFAAYLGLFLILYISLDIFQTGLGLEKILFPMFLLSGLVALFGAGEVYAWYYQWFSSINFQFQFPDIAYRLVTLTGHANSYLGYENVLAPLVLVYGLNAKSKRVVFLAALWIAFYLVTIPFTSSRGGLVGIFIWLFLLAGLWGWDRKIWKVIRSRKLYIALVTVVFGLAAVGGLLLLAWFTRHPTHGTETAIFSGREGLWSYAAAIWQKSPWIGNGLDRYSLGYLQVANSIPPDYWPGNAHSLLLQVLADTGLVGFLAFGCVAWIFLSKAWKGYRALTPTARIIGAAILASLGSVLFYSVPENTLDNQFLVVSVILISAWLISRGVEFRYSSKYLTISILWIPLLFFAAIGAVKLWSYDPFSRGVTLFKAGHPEASLVYFRQAASRDPGIAIYRLQLGLVLANQWGTTGDQTVLIEARTALESYLEQDPNFSLWWADLAVLDWYVGQPESARTHMARASAMAPSEPTYPLNLAWFEEQSGKPDLARVHYLKVLQLAPEWACHPFWQGSAIRREITSAIDCSQPFQLLESTPNYTSAAAFLVAGAYPQAWAALQLGQAAGESELVRQVLLARYYQSLDQPEQASRARQDLASFLERPFLHDWREGSAMYVVLSHRQLLVLEIVPGYMKLEPYLGQFAELQRLVEEYTRAGKTEQALYIQHLLVSQQAGGAITQ